MGNFKNKQEFLSRINNFLKLIDENHTFKRACLIANISKTAGYKYLKGNYKQKGNRLQHEHTFFDCIDSEIKAYLLGFLLADGSISKTKNHITIHNSVNDLQVIEYFQKFITPETKIHFREYELKKNTVLIAWSSKHMKKTLEGYNILPNKTFHLDFTFDFNITGKFTRHFMRGFFDGDGTLTSGRLEFMNNSLPFIKQINTIISSLFHVEPKVRERKTKNVTTFLVYYNSFGKRKMFFKTIYDWFYKDSNYFLPRKKEKFENYLNTVLITENKKSVTA